MHTYIHKVRYYETDRMGITHHSNYIRWMEEARLDFLEKIGWGLEKIEETGVVSPVVSITSSFKQTTTFPDEVEISVRVEDVKGARLKLGYVMKNADGKTVFTASSEHCFTDSRGKVLRLDRQFPELFEALCAAREQQDMDSCR
ncbi:MAG: acyl-CoA thioesterase [Firmicutes bacterium]|nr:acyl-CoA thioesterase [Bacillota bacterium]